MKKVLTVLAVCASAIGMNACAPDLTDPVLTCRQIVDLGLTCGDLVEGTEGPLSCKDDGLSYDTSKCRVVKHNISSNTKLTCGNGIVDGVEVCDGDNVRNITCNDFKEGSKGWVNCSHDCLSFIWNDCSEPLEPGPDSCGNGKIDAQNGEVCDGYMFNEGTDIIHCSDIFPDTMGSISCEENCIGFDTSNCEYSEYNPPRGPYCGNGIIDSEFYNEVCDGDNLGGVTCNDIIPGSTGTLLCAQHCQRFNTEFCKIEEAPSTCGNNMLDRNEVCDDQLLNDKTCNDFIPGSTGNLRCMDNCLGFDTSQCLKEKPSTCGNNHIAEGEVCDTFNTNNRKCGDIIEWGYGTLKCKSDCSGFDMSGCTVSKPNKCGNYKIDEGEVCDLRYLGDKKCHDFIPGTEGDLQCSRDCHSFDTSLCKPRTSVCNDGIIEGDEVCDGTDLRYFECSDFDFSGGTLKCSDDCFSFNTDDCY